MVDLDDSPRIGVAFWRKRDTLQCLWSVASEQPTSAARARLRLPGAVAHEQSAATSSVILFTRRVHGRVYPRKLAAVGFGVMFTVFTALRRCLIRVSATRSRPRMRSGASPLVLNLPNSRSTRERADASRALAVGLDWSKVPTWQSD